LRCKGVESGGDARCAGDGCKRERPHVGREETDVDL
jgi:hypothetical protein